MINLCLESVYLSYFLVNEVQVFATCAHIYLERDRCVYVFTFFLCLLVGFVKLMLFNWQMCL